MIGSSYWRHSDSLQTPTGSYGSQSIWSSLTGFFLIWWLLPVSRNTNGIMSITHRHVSRSCDGENVDKWKGILWTSKNPELVTHFIPEQKPPVFRWILHMNVLLFLIVLVVIVIPPASPLCSALQAGVWAAIFLPSSWHTRVVLINSPDTRRAGAPRFKHSMPGDSSTVCPADPVWAASTTSSS